MHQDMFSLHYVSAMRDSIEPFNILKHSKAIQLMTLSFQKTFPMM